MQLPKPAFKYDKHVHAVLIAMTRAQSKEASKFPQQNFFWIIKKKKKQFALTHDLETNDLFSDWEGLLWKTFRGTKVSPIKLLRPSLSSSKTWSLWKTNMTKGSMGHSVDFIKPLRQENLVRTVCTPFSPTTKICLLTYRQNMLMSEARSLLFGTYWITVNL